MGTDSSGSTTIDNQNYGFRSYCWTYYPSNFNYVTKISMPSFTSMQQEIDNNRAFLLDLISAPAYGGANHAVCTIGYYYDDAFPTQKYVIARDGWPTTPMNNYILKDSSFQYQNNFAP